MATCRNAGQPSPRWDDPRGTSAADDLDRVLAPFVVVCRRGYDGREKQWMRYSDRAEAERVAARLTAIGCPSRVVGDDELALEAARTVP